MLRLVDSPISKCCCLDNSFPMYHCHAEWRKMCTWMLNKWLNKFGNDTFEVIAMWKKKRKWTKSVIMLETLLKMEISIIGVRILPELWNMLEWLHKTVSLSLCNGVQLLYLANSTNFIKMHKVNFYRCILWCMHHASLKHVL